MFSYIRSSKELRSSIILFNIHSNDFLHFHSGALLWDVVLVNYIISSRGQPTRGGPPAWGLGEMLTTPPREKQC